MNDKIYTYKNEDISFTIKHNQVTGQYTMKRYHFHHHYEIYYLLSGERYYFIKDRTYHVMEGDLVFINPHEIHKTIDTGAQRGHERILVCLEKNFIMTCNNSVQTLLNFLSLQTCCVIRLAPDERTYITNLLNNLITESQVQTVDHEVCLQSLAMQLLVFITRHINKRQLNSPISTSPKHEKVSEIVQFINNNYMYPLTIPLISEQFYISPYYFSRIFKEATGFTFVEYLNTIRIREAQILLMDTNLNITQISEKVGFGSITHFNRIFKKILGTSPLTYRKSLK